MPALGVYSATARMPDGKQLPSVVNIGRRPTFGADKPVTTEVHILDYDDNLYGKTLSIELTHYVRPEKKFSGIDELKAQILKDCEQTRQYLLPAQPR